MQNNAGIDYTFCELREKDVVNVSDGKQQNSRYSHSLHG